MPKAPVRSDYRFRLAGTKICEQFGQRAQRRRSVEPVGRRRPRRVASLLRTVFTDGAVGHGLFRAYTAANRQASFEFVLMPLIHTGETINRLLGAITAIEPPFWLGAEPLVRHEIIELHLHWPDGPPAHEPQDKRRGRASRRRALSRP